MRASVLALSFASLASLALLTACAGDPPKAVDGQRVASAAPATKQVCTREVKTGTNVTTTVCRTEAADGSGQDTAADFQRENDLSTMNRVNGLGR